MLDKEIEVSTKLGHLRFGHTLKRQMRRSIDVRRPFDRHILATFSPGSALVPKAVLPEPRQAFRVGAVDRQSDSQCGLPSIRRRPTS